jgi:hypothetical protein
LNQFKKVNKDIEYKINVLDKNLDYEKRKTIGLKNISQNGQRLHSQELNNYNHKKTDAMKQRQKRQELEREIYRYGLT